MYPEIDIIMLALARWDGHYSSTAFSLAKELSRYNRVFYIDNPFTVKDFFYYFNTYHIQQRRSSLLFGKNIHKKIGGPSENLIAVTPRLTYPINWLPEGKLYDTFSEINDKIIYEAIEKTTNDYQIKDFIFINSFNPFYSLSFPKNFAPLLKIYQSVDMIDHASHISKHGLRLENEAIRQADITLTTSKRLYEIKRNITDDVYYLPNAADIELFKKSVSEKYPKPAELRNCDKPIIGYTGNIDNRIDFDLLKKISLSHQDKTLALIGPIANKSIEKELLQYKNIILTGKKPLEKLPQYLQYFDCTIIPFKKNALTSGIYPLKINEYLAAGKPVVTTDFSEDIIDFSKVAHIAKSNDDFITHIHSCIQMNTQDKVQNRVMTAEKNTWEARAGVFWKITQQYLSKKMAVEN